jgi:S1-C subfamily serine protease
MGKLAYKISRIFSFAPQLSVVFLSLVFVTACASPPIQMEKIIVKHGFWDTKNFDKTKVIIHMKPEDRKKTYPLKASLTKQVVGHLDEGLIIESAAIKTFLKIFKNVKSSAFSKESDLLVTISGVSNISLWDGVYTAQAKAFVTLPSGEKLGKYQASGMAKHITVGDKNIFELVYVKAFVKILESMLKDERLVGYFESGFGKVQTANLPDKPIPQSGTGSGFFVSKMGHVVTNAHVVKGCNKITVGDNANKQVPAEVVNTDGTNDLALLKLSSLELASAESKSLIQKLSIVVVPLASKGLLRSEDVRLGEKILVAGYPFGDAFSSSIKVTTGVVSSIRGVGDDSGQFQLDAAVQPGNSGGPIYDSGGNIVGVVISQLNKKTFGSLVENVNFGIKASTIKQFLISSGLSSKKAEQTEEKSTEQLAEIAKNQALMVMCLQ